MFNLKLNCLRNVISRFNNANQSSKTTETLNQICTRSKWFFWDILVAQNTLIGLGNDGCKTIHSVCGFLLGTTTGSILALILLVFMETKAVLSVLNSKFPNAQTCDFDEQSVSVSELFAQFSSNSPLNCYPKQRQRQGTAVLYSIENYIRWGRTQ